MELLDDVLAELTIRDYVCSNCWGHLIKFPVERKWLVICHRCMNETKGYVTKYYAEHRRSDSIGEKGDVNRMLQEMELIPEQHLDETIEELLADMGF
jgi:hypothetical protein